MAITLSAGVRQSLSALQSSAAQASSVQNRLATGKKVNSALDNPASFFTASGLNNRASDLGRLLDDMGQAIKTLEAADKGIKAITKLVENAQSLAKQARSSTSENLKAVGADLTAAITGAAGSVGIDIGGTTVTVTLAATDDTADEILTKFNTAFEAAGVGMKASLADDGKLQLEALGGEEFTIAASPVASTGLTAGAITHGTSTTSETRKNLAQDFDDILTQIDQLAKDAGYNGVNLINGDSLKVTFNEDDTSSLSVKGANLDSTGLSVNGAAGDFQANSNIDAALDELKAATDTLRSQASTFGANLSVVQNRQDFTKGMIDTLTSGADLLVVADSNEEGANLLALNTRSQIAQTTLAMASQADQAVLRLF